VYHALAEKKDEPEKGILINQFRIMEWRLWYIITWPSSILAIGFGIALLAMIPSFLSQPWMHVKLAFVAILFLLQLYTQRIFSEIQIGPSRRSDLFFRFLNEAPTVILIAVVFLVVQKTSFSWLVGLISIMSIALIITYSIRMVRKWRK
jgi:putative membrane protein